MVKSTALSVLSAPPVNLEDEDAKQNCICHDEYALFREQINGLLIPETAVGDTSKGDGKDIGEVCW